ncbi:hypothetical protein PV08_04398 [Exophiala spinifera]|uniref:Uncharacterized protein n=1 Tax=Exophiala spinifera TaxID=91928 RepID=A0A0D1ZWY0_9EURO|nr:uncharacterized protein PV08_04398 [Exophiala spinifera]KIW17207.1 hypothetical protein PV08_04398 [Exophiala spinifera]
MGLSDGLVILICVLVAGLTVAAGAALHQVMDRRRTSSGGDGEGILPFTNEQEHYMRQVRSRNYAQLFGGRQPAYYPPPETTVTTTTHA